ncbi:MAG TPA: TPM domain-containing protein [Noviherbaspirillum sp.]|uniref:TPM domain-containing protein n=1 Tax=Noviherbaspirillum sp. TaxID=1926288 RepID=UPI002D2FAA8D|nr:TPM domain-containing protein [Noviherbaspirillum sp.]HYD95058.1 TPM domain-containing protein [Noviherbaspirillum sp.]
MTSVRALLGLLLALLLAAAHAQEFVPVPPLQTRVTDKVGMLTENQRQTLENVLKEYEERSGSQIAILLVGKTEPEAIEQYGIRVFDEWKLGRKGTDDGVLLLVAKNNPPSLRRLRIEAGRGVQGTLTDAQSKRILQDVIAPHFRQNDFYGGLAAGVSAITSLLDKEKLPAPAAQQAAPEAEEEEEVDFSLILFFVFVGLFILLSRLQSRRYARHRHGWGRSAPGVIIGDPFGHHGGFRGGFGGGFGGSSGGFGGGFSGGGGTADGGGASGNW